MGYHTLFYHADHGGCLDVLIFRGEIGGGLVWDCGSLGSENRNDAVVGSGYRVLSWAFFKYIRIKCLKDVQRNPRFGAVL